VFATAMGLFGTFSAFYGSSNSLGMLVFGRVMQGLSGGSLVSLSQTLLMRIFPLEKAASATPAVRPRRRQWESGWQ
jgi:MFS transporter, DHA2 family, multidrug resistance protein